MFKVSKIQKFQVSCMDCDFDYVVATSEYAGEISMMHSITKKGWGSYHRVSTKKTSRFAKADMTPFVEAK